MALRTTGKVCLYYRRPCQGRPAARLPLDPSPARLWVSGFTSVATWQGFVYVAFFIDAFARRIVGYAPAERRMRPSFSALWSRRLMIGVCFWLRSDTSPRQRRSIRVHSTLGAVARSRHRAVCRGSVGEFYDNASPKRSTGFTRPRSFIGAGRAEVSKPSS